MVPTPRDTDWGWGHKNVGGGGGGAGDTMYRSIVAGARDKLPFFNQPFVLNPMQPGVLSHRAERAATLRLLPPASGKRVSFTHHTSEEG